MSHHLNQGKIPAGILARFIEGLDTDDTVSTGPGVGEDAALIDTGERELYVVTSDPITFATNNIGYYTVLINSNDIATTGGHPRWLSATILFPNGTTEETAQTLLEDLGSACNRSGITLIGGHTEITDAVSRTVVSGTMIGTVERDRVVDKSKMRPGDTILLTKAIAIEGTGLLAFEFADRLSAAGIDTTEIERAKRYSEALSIVEEARTAVDAGNVSAMHDVTEGGIATALSELGKIRGLEIDADRIPILPEANRFCIALGLDPLGLIGSGNLLIACPEDSEASIVTAVRNIGVDIQPIGRVSERQSGVRWHRSGRSIREPVFEVDEIARLYG